MNVAYAQQLVITIVVGLFAGMFITMFFWFFGGSSTTAAAEPESEDEIDPIFEAKSKEPLPKPLDGYLVAAASAPVSLAPSPALSEPPDPLLDGPPSTDSSEAEDELGELRSVSFSKGKKKEVREGSFRKRSDEKIARAKIISSSLTSHLVTPRIDSRRLEAVAEQPATGSQTIGFTPRKVAVPDMPPARGWEASKDGESPDSQFRRRATPSSKKKSLWALDGLSAKNK